MQYAVAVIFLAVTAAEIVWPLRATTRLTRRRWLGNLLLLALNSALMSLPFLAGVAQQGGRHGLFGMAGLRFWAAAPLGFVLMDAAAYLLHRLDHSVGVLWRLHAVHHSDPELDVTTTVRQHPAIVLMESLALAGIVLVLGVPAAAVLAYRLADLLVQTVAHANIAVPQGVSRLLVTPAFHRVHHSPARVETDSNYGQVLALWDHLFGSASRPRNDQAAFGLADFALPRDQDVHLLLSQPWLRRQEKLGGMSHSPQTTR